MLKSQIVFLLIGAVFFGLSWNGVAGMPLELGKSLLVVFVAFGIAGGIYNFLFASRSYNRYLN